MAGERSPDICTVVELCAAYLDHCTTYYRKNGKPTRQLGLVESSIRALRKLYGDLDVIAFTPRKLKALQSYWTKQGLARSTINAYVSIVKRTFKFGVSEESVPAATYQSLATVPGLKKGRSPARETKPVESIDLVTVELTGQQLSPEGSALVRLQLLTGARPGELIAMRPGDIDRSQQPWAYVPGSHKTEHHGHRRTIYLNVPAQDVLSPFLLRMPHQRCFDQYKDVVAYRRAIHRACDRLKIPRWAPNRLRHTAGTYIRKTCGIEAVQAVLGHQNLSTSEVYAERSAELAKESVEALARVRNSG